MRWDEVNLERATWHIPETKNGEVLTIPLTPEAVAILQVRHDAKVNDFVFPGEARPSTCRSPRRPGGGGHDIWYSARHSPTGANRPRSRSIVRQACADFRPSATNPLHSLKRAAESNAFL